MIDVSSWRLALAPNADGSVGIVDAGPLLSRADVRPSMVRGHIAGNRVSQPIGDFLAAHAASLSTQDLQYGLAESLSVIRYAKAVATYQRGSRLPVFSRAERSRSTPLISSPVARFPPSPRWRAKRDRRQMGYHPALLLGPHGRPGWERRHRRANGQQIKPFDLL